jgi:hypothetical protein
MRSISSGALSQTKTSGSQSDRQAKIATSLNCFSMIVPLSKKEILLSNYGDNTKFFINSFENMITEYKVFAQIKPKIDNVTTAIEDLSISIKNFCRQLNTIRLNGLYPTHIDDVFNQLKLPFRIHVSIFLIAITINFI